MSTPNYGTIPTTTTTTPTTSHLSFFTPTTTTTTLSHPPWREFFSPHSLSLPPSYSSFSSRTRRNLTHFRRNYTLLLLTALLLSLLFHPLSLILFLLVFVLWLVMFFCRDRPVLLFGRAVGDRVVLVGLWVVTVVGLVLTGVGVNVLIGLCVGVAVVGVHAAVREEDDDLLLNDELHGGDGAGLVDVVDEGLPLRPTYGRV